MSGERSPTGRDPLRLVGALSVIVCLLCLLAVIGSVVTFVRDRSEADVWLLAAGFGLLFGAVAATLVWGALVGYRARSATPRKPGGRREPPGVRGSLTGRSDAPNGVPDNKNSPGVKSPADR